MSLSDVVKLNLDRYRDNLVIAVPPLVSMIVNMLSLLWLPIYPEAYVNGSQSFLLVGWGTWTLIQVVSFLALLGQASMAGKVVSGKKTSLSDWVDGTRAYFSRALGISMIHMGIVGIFFIPLSRIYYSLVLQPLASRIGLAAPQAPAPAIITPVSTAMMLATTLFIATATAVLYMWIAPIVFEDVGVIASLSSGNRAMRDSGKAFLGLIAIISVISGVTSMVENLPLYSTMAVQELLPQGYLTPTNIASQAINAVISPLWFLIAFTMYRNLQQ